MKLNSIPLLFFTTALTFLLSCKDRDIADVDSSALIKYHFNNQIIGINSAKPTKEEGFIYAGMAANDGILVLFNIQGEMVWETSTGGELDDYFTNVIQTSDGGFLAIGASHSASFGVENNVPDGWMVKFTKEGIIEWQKAIGDDKIQTFSDVYETPDGAFILTGRTNPNSNSTWVVKTTLSGDVIWNKTYEIGPWHDTGKNISLTPEGNIIIHGLCGNTSGGVGLLRFKSFYIELTSDLGILRNQIFFDQFVRDYDRAGISIPLKSIFTPEAVVWVSTMVTSDWKSYIHLVKTGYDGTVHFERKLTGLGVADVRSISSASDGGYVITGATLKANNMSSEYLTKSKCLVIKTDGQGNIEWSSYVGDESSLQYALTAQSENQKFKIAAVSFNKTGDKIMHYCLNKQGHVELIK